MSKKTANKKGAKSKVAKARVAKRSASDFHGRVLHAPLESLAATLGVRRPHQVWIPSSAADVATAIALSPGLRVFVRSGTQATTGDTVDAAGGIVLFLSELNGVEVKRGVLNAGAGATVATVSERLTRHGLALPLSDNPALSVASNVIRGGPSCLMRTLGPLSDYVTRLDAVTLETGPVARRGKSAAARAVADREVFSGVAFKPATTEGLWMLRRSFLYPGRDAFLALARALFLDGMVPAQSDVVLDVFPARHALPTVRITAVGASAVDEAAVTGLVDGALAGLPEDFAAEIIRETFPAAEVMQALVDGGIEIPADAAVLTERLDQVVDPTVDLGEFLSRLADDVDRALGYLADGTGEIDPDLDMSVRLQLNRDDRLRLTGFLISPRPPASVPPQPLSALVALPFSDSTFPADLDVFTQGPERIPNFKGEVFIPQDASYGRLAHQYASSSYPRAATEPFMLAYPRDVADIQAAIAFATQEGKKIVARSGGHQYSGKSSGGTDTIVLSMDRFNHFKKLSADTVEVGPAVMLTDLARRFKALKVTIPHGECPRVCIGGHAQTGGYGHLVRAFGLALDHVIALTIVLADGSVRVLGRPAGAPVTPDDALFWGVLGGNAGSFGIVTSYTFGCIKDGDHPNSFGYAATRKYEKDRYGKLLKQVQRWTQGVVAGTLDAGLDFMMTVESRSASFLPPVLLVDLVNSNLAGEPVPDPNFGAEPFKPIIAAADEGAGAWRFITTKGRAPLSYWSDKFVRRPPATTSDGREFKYPYKKRINATGSALSDTFIDRFADLVDEVVERTPDVYLVFQMLIGGGNFRSSPRRAQTSIPQRDYVFCFVFDLFYDSGAKEVAEDLQKRMQSLIDLHFNGAQERRVFWGSFGDTDMSKPETIAMYYDNLADHARLSALKKTVDPGDLFHTSFTVK